MANRQVTTGQAAADGAIKNANYEGDYNMNELLQAAYMAKQAAEGDERSVVGNSIAGAAGGAAGIAGAHVIGGALGGRHAANVMNGVLPGSATAEMRNSMVRSGAMNALKNLPKKSILGGAALGAMALGGGSAIRNSLNKNANFEGDYNMSELLQAAYMAKVAADGQGELPEGKNRFQRFGEDARNAGRRAYERAGEAFEGAKGKAQEGYAYGKDKVRGGIDYVKANPKRVAGGVAATAAAAAAGIYAYNNMGKEASFTDYNYYDPTYTEPTYEEVVMAKMAAEELYTDCLDKLAYAEQLFEEADFLQGGYEKLAADNGCGEPVSYIDQLRTPVGATVTAMGGAAGAVGGALMARGRGATAMGMGAGAVAGGLLGAATAAGGLSAVHAFTEQHRQARAAQFQATPGM